LYAENLEATRLHTFFRNKFTKWGSSWNYLKYSEIDQIFDVFERNDYTTASFIGTFGRTESQKRIMSKIDTLFFDKVVRPKNRYIVYGIAKRS